MAAMWKERNKKQPEIQARDDKGKILPMAERVAGLMTIARSKKTFSLVFPFTFYK